MYDGYVITVPPPPIYAQPPLPAAMALLYGQGIGKQTLYKCM